MTLRQLWVRIQALPPDSPLGLAMQEAAAQEELRKHSAEVDDALTRYQPRR